MTIVIPAQGPSLDDRSEMKLPHAPYLLFVEGDSDLVLAERNPAATADSHPGIVVAKFLVDRGVDVVLGHHMGPHPAAALARRGVHVHEGRPGLTARELLALYRAGELAVLSEDEINSRHGPHRHGHSHLH